VVVLDSDPEGGRGSRAAAGVAIPSLRLRADPVLGGFVTDARTRLDDAVTAMQRDRPGIRRGCGVLRPARTPAEQEALLGLAGPDGTALGRWIEADEMVEREPVLAGSPFAGAFWTEAGYLVDTTLYLDGLAAAARATGAEIRLSEPVLHVDDGPGRLRIRAPSGTLDADRLVVAAGAWSGMIPGLPPLPVHPLRGQMMELRHPSFQLGTLVSGRTYLGPWREGGICVGATEERAGFAERTTAKGVGYLLSRVLRDVPTLSEAQVRRSWAGLRSASADGRPLLGCCPGNDRTLVGTGHGGQGILTGHHTGWLLAEMLDGRWDAVPPEFAPGRE